MSIEVTQKIDIFLGEIIPLALLILNLFSRKIGSIDLIIHLGSHFKCILTWIIYDTPKEAQELRAQPGFEPGTSCTQSKNHTPRPLSHPWLLWTISIMAFDSNHIGGSYGEMVSTLDIEFSDLSSNLGGNYYHFYSNSNLYMYTSS